MADSATMSETKILRINSSAPDLSVIEQAVELLNASNIVVAPSETRYALIARIDRPQAVEKLFEVKGRDYSKPSAIFVPGITELSEMAELSETATKLADAFLPGPLTLVLKSKSDLGKFFTLNGLTGFRISSSPVISLILEKCQSPISATSANISGAKEPETIDEIEAQLGEKIDLYLDAGPLNKSTSTVVQVIDSKIKILRAGAITESEIRKVLN